MPGTDMKTIKLLGFSFKSEPIWMLVFSIVPGVLGLLIVLFVILFR
jgi:hypothetical protein